MRAKRSSPAVNKERNASTEKNVADASDSMYRTDSRGQWWDVPTRAHESRNEEKRTVGLAFCSFDEVRRKKKEEQDQSRGERTSLLCEKVHMSATIFLPVLGSKQGYHMGPTTILLQGTRGIERIKHQAKHCVVSSTSSRLKGRSGESSRNIRLSWIPGWEQMRVNSVSSSLAGSRLGAFQRGRFTHSPFWPSVRNRWNIQ